MPERDGWRERLIADGLVRRADGALRTTRRWQGAMARAALRLLDEGGGGDLRLPIASALVEIYGELDDGAIALAVGEMLPIELAELAPLTA